MNQSRLLSLLAITACSLPAIGSQPEAPQPGVHHITPGTNLRYRLQELLVQAVPGDVFEFSEGNFELARQIDIATDNITLRGQGPDKTVLSFAGQRSGGQGIEATGDNFVIEQLAIEDTAGNAVKVIGARNVTFRQVRVEWTGPAKSSNGAYGLYPVQCRNVLIDSCVAIGASDAGIYVGQSRRAVVRGCRAERNVAGIEIENTVDAAVYDNVAANNTGGILVFDLPGLQLKAGRNVRVFRNQVIANNHKNFAAPGNIVAGVPSGTGVMIMATDHVEVFDNDIRNNETTSISLLSFFATSKKMKDPSYDPISAGLSIHDNRISGGGTNPRGRIGMLLVPALGVPLPDIVYDGIASPLESKDGNSPAALRPAIFDNDDATFANFNLPELTPGNLLKGKYQASRDLAPYAKPRAPIAAFELKEHDPPASAADPAVLAYHAAPKYLSEYGLFEGDGSTQQPVDGVVPYSLNTTLFSDYTTKYRFIRIPAGERITHADNGKFVFPEGSLLAKTFAYPVDAADPSQGERLLETRIELLRGGQWFGYSYQWNDQQTEASLLLGGGEVEVSWIHSDGQKRTNRYEIPNPNQCLNCHAQHQAYVPIGPTIANMNRDFDYAEGTANQLDHLARKGWLDDLPKQENRERLPVAHDPHAGSLDQRAHAWLHVNCAHCHSPGGSARTSGLDLRFDQSDPAKFGVWKTPVATGHGSGGREYDIVPGEPDQSILLYRMESDDPSVRMPSVGRNLAPTEAVALIREWIAAMPEER